MEEILLMILDLGDWNVPELRNNYPDANLDDGIWVISVFQGGSGGGGEAMHSTEFTV